MCKEQNGFRKYCFYEIRLLEVINDLSSNLNAGIQTDLLLLDFSKVSHKCLLSKLSFME